MNAIQFNPVSGTRFSGRNETAALESKKEHGFKSNGWITYFQASQLGIQVERGTKATGMIRFAKNDKGKSEPKWYNVFNLDQLEGVPAELRKAKTPKATKVAKKSTKKAATKKKAKLSLNKEVPATSEAIAIPVQGMENTFLIPQADGTYRQVTL